MLTLAQQLGNLSEVLDVPEPTALPEPPAWEHHLLEAPLVPTLVLGLVGVLLLAWLMSRGNRRAALLYGGGILALAAAWFAIGTLVQTQRERVEAAARALVLAVAKGDVPAVDAGLARGCVLYSYLTPGGADEARILALVNENFGPTGRFRVTGLTVERVQRHVVEVGGGSPRTAQVQIKLRVSGTWSEFPNRSWWRLDMTQAPDGAWQAAAIMPLSIQGRSDASGR